MSTELPSEKKSVPFGLRKRYAARLAAIQAYYSLAIQEQVMSVQALMDAYLEYMHDHAEAEDDMKVAPDEKHLKKLLSILFERKQEIDRLVSDNLKEGWEFERLSLLMKALLLVAVAELLMPSKLSFKMIVSEYVTIAKEFFTQDEVGFVNGILDHIGRSIRQD